MLLSAIDITKATSNAFQQSLGICHVIIAEESALCGYITERNDRPIFVNGIEFLGALYHLMERNSRNIERRVQHFVVQIIVSTMLTNVG